MVDNEDGAVTEQNEVTAASDETSSSAIDWLEAIVEIAIDTLFAWW